MAPSTQLLLSYTLHCRTFGDKVKHWVTFNEPALASFAGKVAGIFPPGHVLRFRSAARHLANMLEAHAKAYSAIRELPGSKTAQIGIVHNFFWFEPRRGDWLRPWYVQSLCSVLNDLWANRLVLDFLLSGSFSSKPFRWEPWLLLVVRSVRYLKQLRW